jgi:hypothetical protein
VAFSKGRASSPTMSLIMTADAGSTDQMGYHHRRAPGTHYKLGSFYIRWKRPALSGGTAVKARNALSVFRSAGHFRNYVRNRHRPALL